MRQLLPIFGVLLSAWARGASAECLPPPPEPLAAQDVSLQQGLAASGATTEDRAGRVVAPVMVNGQGPFRFIVDTGANRSAISRRLAERLGLEAHGSGQVHSIDGVAAAPLVDVASLEYGGLAVNVASLPMLEGAVLAGADGLLGVDGMQGRRLTIDFESRCIEIAESRNARRLRGWSTIEGELQFGHLLLIEGRVRGQRINVLVDTGAGSNFANTALLNALEARPVPVDAAANETLRAYTAGAAIVLDTAMLIPEVDLGDVGARNVLAYVGDFHIFDVWGLRDEPTLLVGMEVLTQAQGLSIDYDRGVVHFRFEPGVRTGSRIRGATNNVSITMSREN